MCIVTWVQLNCYDFKQPLKLRSHLSTLYKHALYSELEKGFTKVRKNYSPYRISTELKMTEEDSKKNLDLVKNSDSSPICHYLLELPVSSFHLKTCVFRRKVCRMGSTFPMAYEVPTFISG